MNIKNRCKGACLLILLFAQGCGNHIPAVTAGDDMRIPAELESLTQRFIAEARARGLSPYTRGFVLEIVPMMVPGYESAYGLCYMGLDIYGRRYAAPAVKINALTPPSEMKVVLYHELAHCMLNEHHWEGDADIMNPTPLDLKAQNMTWEFAVERMFTRIAATRK